MTAFTLRMLALAASLPLLLPTGVCVCDAVPDCCAPSAVIVAGESHDCCDDCQEPADSQPHPTDDHVPGCPAEKLDGSQWTKPTSSPSVDAVPSVVAVFETPIVYVPQSAFVEVVADPNGELPRYLSFCAFLR